MNMQMWILINGVAGSSDEFYGIRGTSSVFNSIDASNTWNAKYFLFLNPVDGTLIMHRHEGKSSGFKYKTI